MINILILSSGTNASYHFAKTLKEKFPNDFRIVGADINPQHLIPTCFLLDKFFQVPLSKDKEYYPAVLDICKNEKINVILPSFDSDQQLFYTENPDLQKLNVISLGTPKATLPIYEDKEKMTNFLSTHGLPVPKTYNKFNPDSWYFVKPKHGVASIGAKKMLGQDIIKKSDKSDLIIQEVLNEPETTLECFYYDSRLECVARDRLATKAGVCVKARVYQDEELQKIAKQFVKVLKTPMYFNLQFMRDSTNRPIITDVNLRLAGGMSLTYACGWDEVSAVARVLLGKPDVFKSFALSSKEQFVIRAYTDIVTKKTR